MASFLLPFTLFRGIIKNHSIRKLLEKWLFDYRWRSSSALPNFRSIAQFSGPKCSIFPLAWKKNHASRQELAFWCFHARGLLSFVAPWRTLSRSWAVKEQKYELILPFYTDGPTDRRAKTRTTTRIMDGVDLAYWHVSEDLLLIRCGSMSWGGRTTRPFLR